MWVPGSLPFAIALVVIAYRWLEPRATGEETARDRLGAAKPMRRSRNGWTPFLS